MFNNQVIPSLLFTLTDDIDFYNLSSIQPTQLFSPRTASTLKRKDFEGKKQFWELPVHEVA